MRQYRFTPDFTLGLVAHTPWGCQMHSLPSEKGEMLATAAMLAVRQDLPRMHLR